MKIKMLSSKFRNRFTKVVLCCLVTIVSTIPSFSYKHEYWTVDSKIVYDSYYEISSTSRNQFAGAAGKWNNEVGYTVVEISSNVHSSANGYPTGDSYNRIYKQPDPNSNRPAENTMWLDYDIMTDSFTVAESDIIFNTKYSFANSAQPNCFDVYTLMLHELGHTVGLADVDTFPLSYETSVMWHGSIRNREKRDLLADDILGVMALY